MSVARKARKGCACPTCGHRVSTVARRLKPGPDSIRRTRVCAECGRTFATAERPEGSATSVAKFIAHLHGMLHLHDRSGQNEQSESAFDYLKRIVATYRSATTDTEGTRNADA